MNSSFVKIFKTTIANVYITTATNNAIIVANLSIIIPFKAKYIKYEHIPIIAVAITGLITNFENVKFRYNNTFAISINDGHLLSTLNDSLYYNAFMNGLIYRENCYSCIYAGPNRCSDITIGDFWGLHESSILYDKKGAVKK